MTSHVDASGVAVELARPPRRIVSLVPSTTETLCALGLADALVAVTVYCLEPRDVVRGKTRIGGEKNPDLERIRALDPAIRVIMITGSNDVALKPAAMAAGAFAYVTKPVSLEQLHRAVVAALGDSRLPR